MSGLDSSQSITEDVVNHASEHHVHSLPDADIDANTAIEDGADEAAAPSASDKSEDVRPA